MRIIAGEHRGRRLVGPADEQTTRPILDRVKEALFDRLTSMGLFGDFEAGPVADVFCGTGSLGLEALSRGSRRCVFVDRDRSALSGLAENVAALGVGDRAEVAAGDALSGAWVGRLSAERAAVVFVDPPYALMSEVPQRVERLLARVAAEALHAEGVVVVRTPTDAATPSAAGLARLRTDRYGGMALHVYEAARGGGVD
ncbi:MAG: RsmD family RNA methyltransferase [Planctomycetota bacterium]